MNKNFSFETPVMLMKVMGLNKKPTCVGFFSTYKEAQEKGEELFGSVMKYNVNNAITASFFDKGIYNEKEIAKTLRNLYE